MNECSFTMRLKPANGFLLGYINQGHVNKVTHSSLVWFNPL